MKRKQKGKRKTYKTLEAPSSIYQHVPPEPWSSFQKEPSNSAPSQRLEHPFRRSPSHWQVSSGCNLCQWPPHYTNQEVGPAGHKAIFFPEFVSSLRASSLRLLSGCKGSLFFSIRGLQTCCCKSRFCCDNTGRGRAVSGCRAINVCSAMQEPGTALM